MADNVAKDSNEHKWAGSLTFTKGSYWQQRADLFFDSTDWDTLNQYISEKHKKCEIEDGYAIGGQHMVRRLKFEDGSHWVVRLRIPPCNFGSSTDDDNKNTSAAYGLLSSEANCLQLVRDRTTVPVPEVFDYVTNQSPVAVPFMLMEYLPGSVGMDLNFSFIPLQHKPSFFREMAEIQAKVTSIKFPKIGSIIQLENGDYDIGPIPGLGGPFNTSQEFFDMWGTVTRFPRSDAEIRAACGIYADEIIKSIKDFPSMIRKLSYRLSTGRDQGFYPLRHPDFGHNNMVVKNDYKVLGVIDWEGAYTAPVEMLEFPLTVQVVPSAMNLPSSYDQDGNPLDEETQARMVDRREYLDAVLEAEESGKLTSTLSSILTDRKIQDVATAMRLYSNGKMGFYSKVLAPYLNAESL